MNVREREVDGVLVLELSGDMMGGPEAQALNEELRKHAEAGKKYVVIDLGGVKLINSSGLGLLIAGLTVVRNREGDVRLANLSTKVEKLLQVTKLNKVFRTFPSVEDAVQSYHVS